MRILFLLIFLLLPPIQSQAKNLGVAAVVDGNIITKHMVDSRVNLIISSAGLPRNNKTKIAVRSQALQSLINESIQKQHAEAIGLSVTPTDVSFAIAEIEQRNNLKQGGFTNFVKKQAINKSDLVNQLKAQLYWKKIMSRRIRPLVNISDFEVDEAMQQLSTQKSVSEVFLSEIVLAIHGVRQNVINLSKELIGRIKTGSSFKKIAQEFSSGSTAANGGNIGWIAVGQLRDPLKSLVQNSAPNSILQPLELEDNVRIIKVGKKRYKENKIDKKSVENILLGQKMELEARRYMKNLRQQAYIEIR